MMQLLYYFIPWSEKLGFLIDFKKRFFGLIYFGYGKNRRSCIRVYHSTAGKESRIFIAFLTQVCINYYLYKHA
jgi:hypothetical protein